MTKATMKQNTEKLDKALKAWAIWYSKRLERISKGSKEDYTGYEQDLFEALGCTVDTNKPL